LSWDKFINIYKFFALKYNNFSKVKEILDIIGEKEKKKEYKDRENKQLEFDFK